MSTKQSSDTGLRIDIGIRIMRRDVRTARLEASHLQKRGVSLASLRPDAKELKRGGGRVGYQTILNMWIAEGAARARKNRKDRLRRAKSS